LGEYLDITTITIISISTTASTSTIIAATTTTMGK